MKFKSKIDFNRYLSLGLVVGLFVWSLTDVITSFSIYNVFFLALWSFIIIQVLSNLFGTLYIVSDDKLTIKCGKKEFEMDYRNLAIITDTSQVEVYSYFALSKDTLGLIYNNQVFLISPKDKQGFINETAKQIKDHQI